MLRGQEGAELNLVSVRMHFGRWQGGSTRQSRTQYQAYFVAKLQNYREFTTYWRYDVFLVDLEILYSETRNTHTENQ